MPETQAEDDRTENPTFLTTKWVKKNIGVNGRQASVIEDTFITREQLLDALRDGEDLTDHDGIGEKTAGALWEWFRNVYGESVEPDDTLVLDDDGLHLPEHMVGFVGQFTVETPNITMQPRTTDHGLGETSDLLASVPNDGHWNERLSEGQIAISVPGYGERIYEIDDQRTEAEA